MCECVCECVRVYEISTKDYNFHLGKTSIALVAKARSHSTN